MKVGIVGRSLTGKTTLFHALTQSANQNVHSTGPVHGVVVVPDPRFTWFVDIYSPKKQSPATIDFVDNVVVFGDTAKGFSDEAMGELRVSDAMVYVIDAFSYSPADPAKVKAEAVAFQEELGLRDLMLVETRLERIAKQVKSPQATPALKVEHETLAKVQTELENGKRFHQFSLAENEMKLLRGFQLLTAKPVVVVINVSEDLIGESGTLYEETLSYLAELGIPAFCLSADLEKQVAELEPDEQKEFLSELGIDEPVRNKLIRAIYSSCELMTFFTVGEKEVHAWPLRVNSTALEAADSIHSDLARGFIRAEVIGWDDIREAGGWDEAKAAGKLKLVGKEHIVVDGDSLFIRFKV